jgi:uncharacterized BrkB/YihY/UPF0761 family membrane protein
MEALIMFPRRSPRRSPGPTARVFVVIMLIVVLFFSALLLAYPSASHVIFGNNQFWFLPRIAGTIALFLTILVTVIWTRMKRVPDEDV